MARAKKPADLANPLAVYWARRDFDRTSEPRGGDESAASEFDSKEGAPLSFVVQKHWASRLHYDFRLELDGVLLSWAVPKGPSYDPADKPIAVHVEDHPLSYANFEGTIPKGSYGAGTVICWDRGTWTPVGDPRQGMKDGKLVFILDGQKLVGMWELVRITKPGDRQDTWILFKKRDRQARPRAQYDVLTALPDSIVAKPLRPQVATNAEGVPDGAVRAEMPARIAPQLPTLSSSAPSSADWIYEIKFDGYRIGARIENGKVQLITRGGHDWSAKMPGLVKAIAGLGLESGWLDGEIVVLGPSGTPDFHALQNAMDSSKSRDVDYFLFDVPYLEGYDLRQVPLVARRQLLQKLVQAKPQDHLRFSEAFEADASSILESARRMGLEGVIAKRRDAIYESRRTETWLKLKNQLRQEFVIAGFTDRSSGEAEVGALMLGVHDDKGALQYVGNVGTGWDSRTAASLRKKLAKIETTDSPFGDIKMARSRWGGRSEPIRWVQPSLVCEVEFSEWTPDKQVRHAKFVSMRTDKPATEIRRELSIAPAGISATSAGGSVVGGTKVSNPERVVDASTGVTKLEVVRYYESVAEWMIPHLKGRPCSLVRGPNGIEGELFFQKHADKKSMPGIREFPENIWPGHASLIEVATGKALVAAAQMNVIEFHTWNALARKIGQPDRVIFDLDPGEGVKWQQVKEAALLVRGMLEELKLTSWIKTSGGKGLHVVVPLAPREDWDTVKNFSERVVQHMAKVIPQRFVAKSGPANRVGRIFIDYLRNSHGATTAAAFSVRSRPGLGVSMPIAWEQLADVQRGDQWNVRTAREYLSFQKDDPWAGYWTSRQTITAGMKALGR